MRGRKQQKLSRDRGECVHEIVHGSDEAGHAVQGDPPHKHSPMHPYVMSFYIPQDWGRLCLILQRVEDAFYTLVREIRLYRLNKLSKEEKTPRCVKLKKCVVMWEGVSVCSHAACVLLVSVVETRWEKRELALQGFSKLTCWFPLGLWWSSNRKLLISSLFIVSWLMIILKVVFTLASRAQLQNWEGGKGCKTADGGINLGVGAAHTACLRLTSGSE